MDSRYNCSVKHITLLMSSRRVFRNFTFPALFLAIQFIVRISVGQEFDGHYIGNSTLKNFLSGESLKSDPIAALWGLHTQPPLLNGIYGLVLQFSPYEVVMLQAIWMGLTFFQVWCVYQFVKEITKSQLTAVALSIIYQFIPSIVGFAFYGYNTILVQTLLTSLALGILFLEKENPRALFFINFSLVGLFLGKAPFSGLLVIPALLIAHFRFMRIAVKPFPKKKLLATSLTLIILIQGHYLLDFKQVALSSWGANSTLRAMENAFGKETLLFQVGGDLCMTEIINTQPAGQKLSDFPSCEALYKNVTVRTTLSATQGNPNNSKDALMGSIAIADLVRKLLWESKFEYYKVILGNKENMGTFAYFMGEAKFAKNSLAYFKENLLFITSSFSLLSYYLILLLTRGRRKFWRFGIFVISLLLMYLTFSSLMTEIYENDRYKVEANPLYFLSIVWIFSLYLEHYNLDAKRLLRARYFVNQKTVDEKKN